MKTAVLSAMMLLAALPAAPAWADGYLSRYHGGGHRYLSDYSHGGYNPGSRSGYRYYGGPHGRIERKHSASWYRYQDNLRRQRAAAPGDVEPAAGPSALRASFWATPRGTFNPMGIALGWPRGSREICGTYLRKPALCTANTMRYDPLIHGQ